MKINLRKAAVVQNSIRAAIGERANMLSGQHTVQLWAVNDEALGDARRLQRTALEEAARLEEILMDIREQVAAANVRCGVSQLLAEDAVLTAQISRLGRVVKATPAPGAAQLAEQARQINASNEKSAYRMQDSFTVGVFTVADIEGFNLELVSLRRRRTQLSEELITRNISTEINIKDSAYSWLESLGIV
jgi:hypothetical protein